MHGTQTIRPMVQCHRVAGPLGPVETLLIFRGEFEVYQTWQHGGPLDLVVKVAGPFLGSKSVPLLGPPWARLGPSSWLGEPCPLPCSMGGREASGPLHSPLPLGAL
eukprot:7236765-Prorocentrum_lima.AAC.1